MAILQTTGMFSVLYLFVDHIVYDLHIYHGFELQDHIFRK